MLTAREIKSLAERVAKAEALVAAGAVFPVSGCIDYYVVKNGDGSQFYLVHVTADEVVCSCPDYAQRQKAAGQACKHGHAVMLYRDRPATPAAPAGPKPKRSKGAEPAAPQAEAPRHVAPGEALARAMGDPADMDPWNRPAAA